MYTLKDVEIKAWVAAQILHFLNKVENAQAIVDRIQDDPNSGSDNAGIGITVAQRIIDKRESLQFKRFRSLEEIEDIQGLGSDKVKDMVYSLGIPANTFLRNILFDGILSDNWVLKEDTIQFEEEASFRAIADNGANFKNFVVERKYGVNNFSQSPEMVALRSSFVENYDISDFGSHAFALYFYQFDSDNWFSYNIMRDACDRYLGYHPTLPGINYRPDQYLRLFKGFRDNRASATSNTMGILPVVVNYAEWTITIWEAELND